ncbi:CAP domain-containing protein [Corynebacterium comes]|uniref:Cysteine-rich secretory protein family protein n=1 Tax=Corynebacterium comes TaxID=2675218 RepID=A0A6B8VDK4_9CORY|nr:CAP domain-containing protein [Corynebacterium comes]QGU03312.1 Cysteine-rich secretory protein family protein [Corynebacterium comes]
MKNLKRAAIALASAAVMSVGVVSPASALSSHPALSFRLPAPSSSPVSKDAGHIENETVRLLNDYRASRGLNRLNVDPGLTSQARGWSQRMAGGSSFAHSNSNVFENIAWNTHAGSDSFFNQWKGSPGHNRNMLEAGVTKVGVGVAYAPDGKAYATMQLS